MTSGFHESFFDDLAAAEETSFWFHERTHLILSVLDRHARSAHSFLDVGCGNGIVLAAVAARHPEWRVAGTDPFERALQRAHTRTPRAELVKGDVLSLPFQNAFDVAGAFDVLEHLDDDVAALDRIARALKPDGLLILTVPQHRWLWSGVDEFALHRRRYGRRNLLEKLGRCGFTIEMATSFVSLLLPALIVARLGKARRGAELHLPSLVDTFFGKIMAVERALIGMGFHFPAGGSLLVVARRRTSAS